ncbi:MAG: hypothetical protein J1E02_08885, partial [Coprobacter sp.]|nr:hypothetical protein [Coprobacter sp.]
DIRNVTLEAYRNVGGVVGTINPSHNTKFTATITNNTVSNVLIIANKFQVYDYCFNRTDGGNVFKTGFGWKSGQNELVNEFVGGTDAEAYPANTANNVTVARFANGQLDGNGEETSEELNVRQRRATIGYTPLQNLPLLSSWFTDKVVLLSDFNGGPSAYKQLTPHSFTRDLLSAGTTETYTFPFNLPFDLNPDFDYNSGKAGMYVESVVLDGSEAKGGYATVTAENVQGSKDCVLFVTSRDMTDFGKKVNNTTVKNVIVRGNPYAYTGISLAPNEFAESLTFNAISVYDVFQTFALEEGYQPGPNSTLTITDSNLRGYTNCGAGWKAVTFTQTVFGSGAKTGNGALERTCRVESNTTFDNCWFKAPFIIEIADGVTATFNNSQATAASNVNQQLTTQTGGKIRISSDAFGNVTVTTETK